MPIVLLGVDSKSRENYFNSINKDSPMPRNET